RACNEQLTATLRRSRSRLQWLRLRDAGCVASDTKNYGDRCWHEAMAIAAPPLYDASGLVSKRKLLGSSIVQPFGPGRCEMAFQPARKRLGVGPPTLVAAAANTGYGYAEPPPPEASAPATEPVKTERPPIYEEKPNGKELIEAALKRAKLEGKHVLV